MVEGSSLRALKPSGLNTMLLCGFLTTIVSTMGFKSLVCMLSDFVLVYIWIHIFVCFFPGYTWLTML